MHNATTTRSIVGRIAVGLIAAALLLGACGGDDGDAGSGSAVDAAATGGSDDTVPVDASSDDASSDDGSTSTAEGVALAPDGPTGGLQLNDAWPEQVWIPTDITVTGGMFNDLGDGAYHATLFAGTEADLDDLRDALVTVNGTPDSEGDTETGSYTMSYDDLLPGYRVGFQLAPGTPGTALVVNISRN